MALFGLMDKSPKFLASYRRPVMICPWLKLPWITIFYFSPFKPYVLIMNCSFHNMQPHLPLCCVHLIWLSQPSELSLDVTFSSIYSSLFSLFIGLGYPTCSHSPPLPVILTLLFSCISLGAVT